MARPAALGAARVAAPARAGGTDPPELPGGARSRTADTWHFRERRCGWKGRSRRRSWAGTRRGGAERSRTEPSRTQPGHTEPGRARPNWAEGNAVETTPAHSDRAESIRTQTNPAECVRRECRCRKERRGAERAQPRVSVGVGAGAGVARVPEHLSGTGWAGRAVRGLLYPAGSAGRWAVPVSCRERPPGRGWAWPGVPARPDELRPARVRGQRAVRGSGPAAPLPSLLSLLSPPFSPGAALGLLGPLAALAGPEAVTVFAGPEQRCLRGSVMVRCLKEPHNPRRPCSLPGQPSAVLYGPDNTC